ncbi:DUF4232 domain-containing protein [Actinophytocola sp. S1-96]|uniref:DUF4232 domain-containing protein n=2 Tax=Actinophytocola gossypii TaxID=2812003 RepID=A0ABT2JFW1_9PSEU|nr:DUF4232 domain-containing protein [Actinophytocola gossypii]
MMVVGGVALAMLAVGCDTTSNDAASPPVPTISDAAGATSTTAPTSEAPTSTREPAKEPATPAPAPATREPVKEPASPRECQTSELKLSLGSGQGAAGTVYRPLRFTNVGDRTCVIQGFPGVSYVTGDDGRQVGPAAYRVGTKGPAISLAPGATVHAPVGFTQVGNYDPAECRPTHVRGLRVYPPHEYDSMFLPAPGTGCAGDPPGHQLVVKTVTR